jgi:shikimate kinase
MAVGKTSVAKLVAKKLRKRYVSTDDLIVKRTGKTVAQIFNEEGEEAFRRLEIEAVKEVCKMKDMVVDCGGGVVVNKINIDRLKRNGIIFLLKASANTILQRNLKEKGKRPLLKVEDQVTEIKKLLKIRELLYVNSADYVINTTNLNIEQVTEEIIGILNNVGDKSAGVSKKE